MCGGESRARLNTLMGLWGEETAWQIEGRLPELPRVKRFRFVGLERHALAQSLDVASARQRLIVGGEQLGVSRAMLLSPSRLSGRGRSVKQANGSSGRPSRSPFPCSIKGRGASGGSRRSFAGLSRRITRKVCGYARRPGWSTRDSKGLRTAHVTRRTSCCHSGSASCARPSCTITPCKSASLNCYGPGEQQIQAALAYVETLLDYWLARTDLEQLLSGRIPSGEGLTTGRRVRPQRWVRTQGINREGLPMAAKMSRREMLGLAAATIGGVTALSAGAQTGTGEHPEHARPEAGAPHPEPERPSWEESYSGGLVTVTPLPPGRPGKDYGPWSCRRLHAPVEDRRRREGLPPDRRGGGPRVRAGLTGDCWGYNGRVHGPTIEAVEGDRVRIYVTNRLPAADDRALARHPPAERHGRRRRPHAAADPAGRDVQVRVHAAPARHVHVPPAPRRDDADGARHDGHVRRPPARAAAAAASIATSRSCCSEWSIDPGTQRPDPNEMTDFNVLTFNAQGASRAPRRWSCKHGDRVRIRFGNLSAMDHHPIHLHGYHFTVTATDGGRDPRARRSGPRRPCSCRSAARAPSSSSPTSPATGRMHCHMTHHVMNQMGHGIPNMIGVEARRARRESAARCCPAT